jgi:Domain of unknown function (DUF6438)
MLRTTVTAVIIFSASVCGADPIQVPPDEAIAHQTFKDISVAGVAADRIAPFGAELFFQVNPDGRIGTACVYSSGDMNKCRALDASLFQGIRYRPFLRNGKAVSVSVAARGRLFPQERKPKKTVSFPATNLASLQIRLSRGACFGTCPAYDIVIDGFGNVVWSGRLHTASKGEHRATVSAEVVQQLVRAFAAANFFSLDDAYRSDVPDHPTHALTLTMSGKTKTITDYIGLAVGMPKAVDDLENLIDEVAGTERWLRGTP